MANVEAQPLRAGLDTPDKDPHNYVSDGVRRRQVGAVGSYETPGFRYHLKRVEASR